MSKHTELGRKAETFAIKFLETKGYVLLEKNWRYSHWEVDLICKKGNEIIFVEVKCRSSIDFGFPEEFVNPKKKQNLFKAAEMYLSKFQKLVASRFDIVSVIMNGEEVAEITHFEDAFYE